MKNRCYQKSAAQYKDWGGRGIIVCDEWKENAGVFVIWCLENGWSKGLDIDRRDNDGNYEPSNCRFVTRRVNNLNKRKQKSNTSGLCWCITC